MVLVCIRKRSLSQVQENGLHAYVILEYNRTRSASNGNSICHSKTRLHCLMIHCLFCRRCVMFWSFCNREEDDGLTGSDGLCGKRHNCTLYISKWKRAVWYVSKSFSCILRAYRHNTQEGVFTVVFGHFTKILLSSCSSDHVGVENSWLTWMKCDGCWRQQDWELECNIWLYFFHVIVVERQELPFIFHDITKSLKKKSSNPPVLLSPSIMGTS